MSLSKSRRQFTIKEIIASEAIANQEDLIQSLGRLGIEITQATLSRDLAELGVARVSTADGPRYALGPDGEDRRVHALLSYEVVAVERNESLVVVKTLPGRAQGVAELIDGMKHPEVLATLAGDNTIFVAPRTVAALDALVSALRDFITPTE